MKKVAFTTLETANQINSSAKNGILNKPSSSKQKNESKYSLRFEVVISNDDSDDNCPEISYKQLVKDFEEEQNLPNDLDSIYEREEENKLKDIVKKFEAKYAPKKRCNEKDEIDIGFGYDSADSFIDNGEAYDEFVDSKVTTKYGGFYINCGKLEFRVCSDQEDNLELDEAEDEDSDEFKSATRKRKHKINNSKTNAKRRKNIIDSDEDDKSDESSDESDSSGEDSDSDSSSENNSNQQINISKQQKNKSSSNPIDSIIESVVNKSKKTDLSEELNQPKLPDNLPKSVIEKLGILKEMKLNHTDKKQRYFSDEVNKLILEIEIAMQNCPSNIKNQVYFSLTVYLAVAKDTLIKRIKKLRISHEENRLKQNISSLRVEVSYLIEELEDVYEAKLKKWQEDKKNNENVPDALEVLDKEFKFDDKIRDLLKKILSSKRYLIEIAGIKGKLEEDNITNFFNNEIKNIWPSNWISNSTLLKTAGFVSKYNQQDSSKQSVSVIKNSNNNSSNNSNNNDNNSTNQQPLNLNISKTNLPTANHTNSIVKPKHKKDSNEKSNKNDHHKSSNEKSNKNEHQKSSNPNSQQKTKSDSILFKSNKSTESKSTNQIPMSLTNEKQLKQFIKSQINMQNEPENLKYSMNQINNMNNIEQQMHQKLNQQQAQLNKQKSLKMHQQQLINQQQSNVVQSQKHQQQKSVSSQSKSSSTFDNAKNLTNFTPVLHNPSSQNIKKSSPQQQFNNDPTLTNLSNKQPQQIHFNKDIAQRQSTDLTMKKQFSQHINNNFNQQQQPNKINQVKQSINKTLEVDYKFDKAIKKSVEENSNAQQSNQFHRSTSLPNDNITKQQQQVINQLQKSITPKPAHCNSSRSNNVQNSAPLQGSAAFKYFNPQQQQELFKHLQTNFALQYLNQFSEFKKQAGNDKKSNDLNSSTNSINNNFKCGNNNFTGNNSNQQININKNTNQVFANSNNSTANVATSNSQANNSINSQISQISNSANNQINNSINSTLNKPVNLAFKTQQTSLPKNDFDINSLISNEKNINLTNQINNQTNNQLNSQIANQLNSKFISSSSNATNRFPSPNNLQNTTNLTSTQNNFQNSELASNSISNLSSNNKISNSAVLSQLSQTSDKNYDLSCIYSDYMNLNPQVQQQIQQQHYQRNIQRQDDPTKRK